MGGMTVLSRRAFVGGLARLGASAAGLGVLSLVPCAGAVAGTARRQSDARMDGMMSLHRRFITRQANAV